MGTKGMDTENRNISTRIALIIFLVIIVVIAAVFGIPAGREHYEKEQKKATVDEARAYFENEIPNDLKKAYEDFRIPGELEVKAESKWENSSFRYKPVFNWEDTLTVMLRTDDSFNELEEREKCRAINDFGWKGIDSFQTIMEQKFPGYFSGYELTAGVYDRTVMFDINYHFYIKTSKGTYRYLGKPDCYGIGTGDQVHRVQDEETEKAASKKKTSSAPTPTPRPLATYTPSKESSLKGKETDPYEAHLYDDPDEYADRYAEEFAEEIGEDTDEGYWEAYDHWNYWHDMHD